LNNHLVKSEKNIVTRFAPSPTGKLHVGSAYAAVFAYSHAQNSKNGQFLIRFEDIDRVRCSRDFESQILDDLSWLGIKSARPIRRQSEHILDYTKALRELKVRDLIYPCFCSRQDIRREIASINIAPHQHTGLKYPGTCRHLSATEAQRRELNGESFALRLNMDKALQNTKNITWTDPYDRLHSFSPDIFGDVILARKDIPTSYHLAVTVDDHIQGINLVTRGEDLYETTAIHRLLQEILGYEAPQYLHHPLLLNQYGERFSKRNYGSTLTSLRKIGVSPNDLRDAFSLENNRQILDWIKTADKKINK